MKYLIAYKQDENTILYVNSITTSVGVTMVYSSALDFISEENAINVCKFLNEYDTKHEYIVLKYTYSIKEINK
jgi:hypothetical protein